MSAPGGRPPDPFERGQRETEALKEALDHLREDVRAMVREEVARTGSGGPELERRVREAVAREIRRTPASAPLRHAPALVAAGVVVGLVVGVAGYRLLDGGAEAGTPSRPPVAAGAQGAPGSVGEPEREEGAGELAGARAATPGPEERAALYDSLFAARSGRLEPMVSRLEAAGPAGAVAEAIGAWRAGDRLDDAGRRRLHDALVQLALNEEADAGLTLDGLLTRGPCGGNSCGALLELWRARGDELGMPPVPEDAATDTPTLGLAERVLVLRRAEAGGTRP